MSDIVRTRDALLPTVAATIVGVILGAGGAAGITLLLEPGPGALANTGFLVALALAALTTALWVGMAEGAPVRGGRRWAGGVAAFLAAAPFAEAWIRHAPLRAAGWGRALAVLLLVAAPAYALGMILAALQRRSRGVGVAALGGVAAGAFVAAISLIPKLDPGILFAGGTIGLIGASWLGGARERERVRDSGSLAGKVAIVTGVGARGQVGYRVAEMLLARGARVVLTARGAEVEALARELAEGAEVVGVAADLTGTEGVERVVGAAREAFGRLDVLINVAGGLTVLKPLGETSAEEWAGELDRNARTAFLMSRAALPLLRESRGTIVNFASPAGLRAAPGIGAYSAAKAAVVALTRAMALEEQEHGVRVNAVAPGMIDTDQNRSAAKVGEANRAAVADPDQVAWVTRDEVAEVALFLAGPGSAGVTGETIEVVGGGGE